MDPEPDDAPTGASDEGESETIGRNTTVPADRSTPAPPPRELGPPAPPERAGPRHQLGRYAVCGLLGRGGMGEVYEAVDDELDRRIAVKVLRQHVGDKHRRRLLREARALAKLSHPNVVHVYEVGEAEGEIFVAMELVRGRTLGEWVQQVPRPSWRDCVQAYLQAGEGLAAAHVEGLVHRDFKPGNAIIDEHGHVRVLDFGLARRADDETDTPSDAPDPSEEIEPSAHPDTRLTMTGAMLGTPAYMPLEQMQGGEVDARSDQFSFCVSLYEAVYGERPFRGDTIESRMLALLHDRVRPAPKATKVPAWLRQLLLRGLLRDPAQRWPSMRALLDEVRRRGNRAPRRGLVLGAVALAILGTAAITYAAVKPPTQEELARDEAARAKQLYEEGKVAYRRGEFDEALAKWSESYDLSEQPLLLYNMSMAYQRRHSVSEDVDDLRKAKSVMESFLVTARANDIDPDDAQEQITALETKIAAAKARDPR